MIVIYHYPRTRSIRAIWLCEELGIPYEKVTVDFSPGYRASPEWRRLNPVGKVPAMRDGELTMFESGAMVEYLLERYGEGRLRPPHGTPESAHYLQWSWFAEATFARPLGDMIHHTRLKPEAERIPAVVEDARGRALLCMDAVEEVLDGREWLLGEAFTGADIMMGYSLALARLLGLLEGGYPRTNAYFGRLSARPGFQEAMADAE